MTIKELADKIGTNKTNVRRTIDRLGLSDQLERRNNVIDVPEHVVTAVLEHVAEQHQNAPEQAQNERNAAPQQNRNTSEQALMMALEAMREQLSMKDEQIRAQQQTIDALTAALTTSQALQAGQLQTLHHLTAPEPAPVAREPEEEQEQEKNEAPESPQTHETTPRNDSIPEEQETPQNGAQRPTDATPHEQPKRRGFFGLFRR